MRKNANYGCYLGTISSNFKVVSRRDRILQRVGMFALGTMLMINATRDFGVFYEIFYHLPEPATKTYYEHKIPKEVANANNEIIQNWQKIHKAKKLLRTYQV